MIAASLAQIGEFSFILANLGVDLGAAERGCDSCRGRHLSIWPTGIFAAISRFKIAAALAPAVGAPAGESAAVVEISPTALTGHAVIIGYGRVGGRLGETLRSKGHTVLAIEDNGDIAAELRGGGVEVIAGNAAAPEILNAANLRSALAVAVSNAFEAGQIIEHGAAQS
jgi:CPA2 family monovalent cation:H+ antiporter-2